MVGEDKEAIIYVHQPSWNVNGHKATYTRHIYEYTFDNIPQNRKVTIAKISLGGLFLLRLKLGETPQVMQGER